MSLVDFSSKTKTCSVELVGGETVDLTFRPFTLADLAWMQEEFPTEEESIAIAQMKAEPLCKIIWNQLTAESKSYFSNIRFEKYDEETEETELIKVLGYKKILHSLKDDKEMIKAFMTYSEVENLNSFVPDQKKKMMATPSK